LLVWLALLHLVDWIGCLWALRQMELVPSSFPSVLVCLSSPSRVAATVVVVVVVPLLVPFASCSLLRGVVSLPLRCQLIVVRRIVMYGRKKRGRKKVRK